MNSYLDLNFDVLNAATGNRCVDDDDIRLVNVGPIALFNNYKSTTSRGKHLEDFSHAYTVSLMYKLITSSKDNDDLSIGFERDRNRRKTQKGTYHVLYLLEDVFGFAEHQDKATYGLGYNQILTRKSDNSVLNKDIATNIGRIKINGIEWYVLYYTPSIPQQALLSKQVFK